MRLTLLLSLFSLTAFAQTPAPSQFFGAGISFLPTTSPKPTGNAFVAAWSNSSHTLINIEEIDFTWLRSSRTIQTSIIADAATPVTMLGRTWYAFVGAGGATGATSSAAFAAGGFASFALKDGWRLFPGAKVLRTVAGGSQVIAFVDVGRGK